MLGLLEPRHFKPRTSLSAPPAGLQFAPDREEWEVVFPALWRREPVDAAGGSGGSADPGWVRGGGARAQAAGSSREVRSVAPAPPVEPAEGQSEPRPQPRSSSPPAAAEEDEELESQELPRGSSGAAALSPGAPASWQPPPPQPPPSPPPAQEAEPDGDEVLLRIPAFSRDLYLLLRRDGRFLAPRFAVEQRPSPGPGPTRAAAAPSPPAPPDASCFYTGAVLRHPGSLASFSTCGGGLVSALPSPALHFSRHSSFSPHTPGWFACTLSPSKGVALNFTLVSTMQESIRFTSIEISRAVSVSEG